MARPNSTEADLHAERARLDAEIARVAADVPDEARDVVADIDRIVEGIIGSKNHALGKLIEQRNRIDAEFGVRRQEERERKAYEAEQQIRARAEAVLEANARRLAAVERMQQAVGAFVCAFRQAREANADANAATKELSGGTWSSFGDQPFVNRISGHLAKELIAATGARRFGTHVELRDPVAGVRPDSPKAPESWREREERAERQAIDWTTAELQRVSPDAN